MQMDATWKSQLYNVDATDKVFPHKKPNIIEHNLRLLKQFYLTQHKYYHATIEKNFHQIQSKDIRYIHEPLQLPLVQIHLNECNPDIDINTTKPTIQIIHDKSHIFTNNGNHLITISNDRLEWLWNQYNINSNTHHQLDPPCQPFITKIIWLYERYKYRIPKTDPLKRSHYTLPTKILDQIITLFNIKISYFSSLVTYSTFVNTYYSPFPRNFIFGSRGTTFKLTMDMSIPTIKKNTKSHTLGPPCCKRIPKYNHHPHHTRWRMDYKWHTIKNYI